MNQELILKAINFAVDKHNNYYKENPYRKGTKIPYIVHPLGVMNILLKERSNKFKITDDVIVAGILHDTVEDTHTSLEEIKEKFGENVKKLVFHESEPEYLKNDPDKEKTWKSRKEYTVKILKKLDKYSKIIACADKLDNIRSMKEDIFFNRARWKRFDSPEPKKENEGWYYKSILESLQEGESIEDSDCFKLFKKKVKEVFNK